MNDKKFIHLLNLYIDGEATPPEARAVEREIEINPARRRIFDDYCRIQVATRALYSRFRREADTLVAGGDRASGRTRAAGVRSAAIAGPGRASGPSFRRALFWAGGAAAACLALAATFWSMSRFSSAPGPVQTAESPGVSVPTAGPAEMAVASSSPSYAAPFAAAARMDSYVTTDSLPAGDPFSLSPGLRSNPFGDPDLTLRFSPASAPASYPVYDPTPEAERQRKLQSILRREGAPQQRPFVPVNLRQQP